MPLRAWDRTLDHRPWPAFPFVGPAQRPVKPGVANLLSEFAGGSNPLPWIVRLARMHATTGE